MIGESENSVPAPRVQATYWCSDGHETTAAFAEESAQDIPEQWDCPRCGLPAGRDKDNPPVPQKNVPYKTHLDYVKERRSDDDGAALLDEALSALRSRRGASR